MKRYQDPLAGSIVFIVALLAFWFSPVHQVSDSKFSMVVSQSLIDFGSFKLDGYDLPRFEPVRRDGYINDGEIYQLQYVGDHLYYFFPPGSPILSVPYVVVANAFGLSSINPDGTYNHLNEIRIETGLAAILMAGLVVVVFMTGRLILPVGWSVLIALASAFCTQVWSTASRGLWSHTWGILLLAIVVYLLLAAETKRHNLNPILLATLLSWIYFVRPTSSVFIIGISIYVFLFYRQKVILYALTGAAWLAGFVAYSMYNFGQLLPDYYRAKRLRFDSFAVALPGNLFSPARGLLVFVPVLFFIGYLFVRYWRERNSPRLLWLTFGVLSANLIAISGFPHWWGGASYGPRFMTEAVPWLVLASICAIEGWRSHYVYTASVDGFPFRRAVEMSAGGLLVAISIFINARGATAMETSQWNQEPHDLRLIQKKLWDWRQPQFLAGLVRPPLPMVCPSIEVPTRINFTAPDIDKYLWYGWGGPEPDFRWTASREAAMVFALDYLDDVQLRISLSPFVVNGVHERQRVTIELNGHALEKAELIEGKQYELWLTLPAKALQRENILTFRLPDAASPESLKLSADQRLLGIDVDWMEFEPKPGNR